MGASPIFNSVPGLPDLCRNPWEHRGQFDRPPMTLNEIFGLMAVPGGLRISN